MIWKNGNDNISNVMHSKRWILGLKMISGMLEKIISFELVIDGILFANQFFTVMQYLEFVIFEVPKMHTTKLRIAGNKPSTRGSIWNGCIWAYIFEYYEALAALLSLLVHLAPIFESVLIGGTSNNALASAKSHSRSRNSICMQ